jgi:hypothetical protein
LISIYCLQNSIRLQYISRVIFGDLLGLSHNIIEIKDKNFLSELRINNSPSFAYGIKSDIIPCIPDSGLLNETTVSKKSIHYKTEQEILKIWFSSDMPEGFSIDFDVFSAAFYLLTEYENYTSADFDNHGRYDENANPFFKEGYSSIPVLHIYAGLLFDLLIKQYPQIQRFWKSFDYKVTFDVDAPYLFRHRPLLVSLGSLFKNILTFNVKAVVRQLLTLSGKADPYDVYDYILNTAKKEKLFFFFLIDRHHQNDGRITYKSEAYKTLIRKLAGVVTTGIHPSYTSYLDDKQIDFETRKLELITGKKITASRMHFLKYRLPDTFRALEKAGISDDYTPCMLHSTGFRNFIAIPFPWFDLKANTISGLILHPTMVMDRSLQKYMGLSTEEAWNEIKTMIDTTYKFKGVFTILFHNSTLSETDEWKGWKNLFEQTVSYLESKRQS